jgi:GTP 3',8-cyclase
MAKNIDYLRLSVTDRCNLNCLYCAPLERTAFLPRDEILSYEEMTRAVRAFVKMGIRKVRLTGGEPLIKKDLIRVVEMLKGIPRLEDLSLTTNGVFLKEYAARLKKAGLDRVNISLDTLKKEKFASITGEDRFCEVWEGVLESLDAGLNPVKLNVIPMKGINDDEINDFATLTLKYPLIVRFIELFPVNQRSQKYADRYLETSAVKERITCIFREIEETKEIKGSGPARYFRIKGAKGSVGFINGRSGIFCDECNRIRMDCAGRICPCLFSGGTHNLRPFLKGRGSESELLEYIGEILSDKYKYRKDKDNHPQMEMSSIGG